MEVLYGLTNTVLVYKDYFRGKKQTRHINKLLLFVTGFISGKWQCDNDKSKNFVMLEQYRRDKFYDGGNYNMALLQ